MRETRFRAQDHREQMPSGAAILTDGSAMDDLLDKLHNGYAPAGWEGDPRLCLAFNRRSERWECWRRENDDQYRLVGLSRKGLPFPADFIQHLVSIDGRRGYDIVKDLERHEKVRQAAEDYKFSQVMTPKIERLGWALRKDLNVGKKTVAF